MAHRANEMSWSHRQSRALGPPPVVLINRKGDKRRASLVRLDAEFRNNTLGEPGSGLVATSHPVHSCGRRLAERLRLSTYDPEDCAYTTHQSYLATPCYCQKTGAGKTGLDQVQHRDSSDHRKIFPNFL
jgi:hypothetical protein